MDLPEGTRVIITAGASGLGRKTAETFHEHGARIHICDISAEHGAAAVQAIPGLGFTIADVSDPDQVDKLFDEATEHLGGLDVLINNAGVAGPACPFDEITPEQWQHTMAVNVNGQFYCARRAAPMLKESGGGSIINMSSIGGHLAYPLRLAYATSKRAVLGLTETLAAELGEFGIRVNAILPGPVEGPRIDNVLHARAKATNSTYEEVRDKLVGNMSLRRMIQPQDIANMILFLCSESGRNVSGQNLRVCGNTESLR